MASVTFRFYEELNDFLPPAQRRLSFTHVFHARTTVKDMIEALGVLHTEVELILANEVSVDFSYIVQDGDRIAVYPVFEALDITPVLKVRTQVLRNPRFVLDTHLGRLARYLRLLGFDCLYRNDYADEALAEISVTEQRILLTRDRGLLKRRILTHGYYLRATDPRKQVCEVIRRLDLGQLSRTFTRCARCNGSIEPVAKHMIAARLEPNTCRYFHEFWTCRACRQVYWKGSHYTRLKTLMATFSSG